MKDNVHLSCGVLYYYYNSLSLATKAFEMLHDNKETLISHISSIDAVEFSAELCRSRVISKAVKDIFTTLDDSVHHELRLRYLLQQICDGVERNFKVFQRFLQILTKHGGRMKEAAKHLGEEWRVSEGGEECQADSSLREGGDLLEEDVEHLMEILAEETHKWEELGIALGMPEAALEDCRGGGSNTVRLHKLLCKWVKGGYRNAQPATLKKLKQKLASPLVGVSNVAEMLEKKFWEAKTPVSVIVLGRTPGLATSLSIESQSYDTMVADGTSTLLEVLVSDSKGVSYLWKKDGHAISDNLAYTGTHTAILAISPAIQGTQGEYICHVMKDREEVISEEILLTVSFSPEKKLLIVSYSKQQDVPEDSWPPHMTSTFINLVLVKKSKGVMDDYKYSVRGNVDDILETKEKIEFKDVFGTYKGGALVLLEGRPGSGKTTLAHKVSRDWATCGEVLKNAKLVFNIPLRSLGNEKTKSLSDLLGLLYQNQNMCDQLVSDIESSNGEGVCFIIDGLDEFHPEDETKSVIHRLLYDKYLSAAMIIVASRPVATGKLRSKPHVSRRIEVLGFSQQQIFEYIDNYPFTPNSDTSPSQLKAYLNEHHNLLHMCYLPVQAAMICFLYEHEKGVIPRTETKIYELFTRLIVLRQQRRSNEDAHLDSLEDLRGDDKKNFSSICQLAFDMTIRRTQTVHQSDTTVPLSLGTGSNDASSLGLLTIDRPSGLGGHHNTFAFLHLTHQEYLAASHLAEQKEEEQMEMITLHAGETNMPMVWKFYSGMVKFENKVAQIEHIIRHARGTRRGYASVYGVQCAYESQQHVVCDSIVKGSRGKLSYYNSTLSLADMTAVGYVISTTSHPVTRLAMDGCHLHDDHVRTLLKKIILNKLKCIEEMHFQGNNLGAKGAVALADGLKSCSNLKVLNLSTNNIDAEGAVALADGLKSCSNLKVLNLSTNNIDAEGAVALADGLKSCSILRNLYLPTNNIGAEGAVALADGLKSCSNLRILDLTTNNIGAEGAVALADGLKSCSNLRALVLSANNIGAKGAVALADGLKSCSNLLDLDLTTNNIGVEGAVALADGLKSCSNLRLLDLTSNNIGAEGAVALADGLKSCSNLQHLDLSANNIGAEAKAAIRARPKCPSLYLQL